MVHPVLVWHLLFLSPLCASEWWLTNPLQQWVWCLITQSKHTCCTPEWSSSLFKFRVLLRTGLLNSFLWYCYLGGLVQLWTVCLGLTCETLTCLSFPVFLSGESGLIHVPALSIPPFTSWKITCLMEAKPNHSTLQRQEVGGRFSWSLLGS